MVSRGNGRDSANDCDLFGNEFCTCHCSQTRYSITSETLQVITLKESLAVKAATLSNTEQVLQETKANLEASSSSGDELAAQNGKVFPI